MTSAPSPRERGESLSAEAAGCLFAAACRRLLPLARFPAIFEGHFAAVMADAEIIVSFPVASPADVAGGFILRFIARFAITHYSPAYSMPPR